MLPRAASTCLWAPSPACPAHTSAAQLCSAWPNHCAWVPCCRSPLERAAPGCAGHPGQHTLLGSSSLRTPGSTSTCLWALPRACLAHTPASRHGSVWLGHRHALPGPLQAGQVLYTGCFPRSPEWLLCTLGSMDRLGWGEVREDGKCRYGGMGIKLKYRLQGREGKLGLTQPHPGQWRKGEGGNSRAGLAFTQWLVWGGQAGATTPQPGPPRRLGGRAGAAYPQRQGDGEHIKLGALPPSRFLK